MTPPEPSLLPVIPRPAAKAVGVAPATVPGVGARVMLSETARVLILLNAAHLVVDLYSGVWAMYKARIAMDVVLAGYIQTASIVAANVLQPLVGFLSDRYDRRPLVIGGVLLGSAAMSSIGFFEEFWVLLFLCIAARIGIASFHPAGTGAVGQLSGKRRGTAIAGFVVTGTLGFALSQGFCAVTFDLSGSWLGWSTGRTALMAVPGLFLGAVLVFILPRSKPVAKADRATLRELGADIRGNGRALPLLFVITTMTSGILIGTSYIMPEAFQSRGYPEWIHSGGGFFASVMGGIPLVFLGGYLSDRFSRRAVIAVSLLLGAPLYMVWTSTESLSAPALLALLFFSGGLLSVATPVAVSYGHDLFGRHKSAISGFLMGLAWATGSLSTLLVAHLSAAYSITTALQALGAFAGLALLCALALPRARASIA